MRSLITPTLIITSTLLALPGTVAAAVIDLANPGDQTTINGVIFYVPPSNLGNIPSGSGNFLRLNDGNDAGTVQAGFNTSEAISGSLVGPAPDGFQDAQFASGLLAADIPILAIGGVDHYELALSIQQTGNKNTIDLNEFRVGKAPSAAVTNYENDVTGSTIIQESSTDTLRITDNYSGTNLDLLAYVPVALLNNDPNFVLYSAFDTADDGPDEWAVNAGNSALGAGDPPDAIPEPATCILTGIGFVSLAIQSRRRRRRSQRDSTTAA